jgi:hypothetical protein
VKLFKIFIVVRHESALRLDRMHKMIRVGFPRQSFAHGLNDIVTSCYKQFKEDAISRVII